MLKKTAIVAFTACLALAPGELFAQKKAADEPGVNRSASAEDEGVTRDGRIPLFMKRLVAGIKNLKVEPDQEGRYIFTIKSGYHYDLLERQHLMTYRKAYIYMSGDRVTKIIFEYYQFSMDSNVRDVKIFTNTTPESDELKALRVDYSSNTGEKETYTVADVSRRESRRSVIGQYVNYLISLVFNIEMYKHKTVRIQSVNIERTIQLGE
jgi:hypothetical protein